MSDTPTVEHASGAKTSPAPRLDLLPYHGLVRCAARFEKGETRYGHDNWRKGLTDKQYVIERAGHILNHAARLIAKLEGHIPDDGDDDAGAIAWGGMFLCEAMAAMEAAKQRRPCSGCGGQGSIVSSRADGSEPLQMCPACKGSGKAGK